MFYFRSARKWKKYTAKTLILLLTIQTKAEHTGTTHRVRMIAETG
jgi:hypothetical protein